VLIAWSRLGKWRGLAACRGKWQGWNCGPQGFLEWKVVLTPFPTMEFISTKITKMNVYINIMEIPIIIGGGTFNYIDFRG
jgi:hypothetical protein